MRQIHSKWLPWAAALLMLWAPGMAAARTCDIDAVPAATLLIPYFEVDPATLVAPFPGAAFTTVFAIVNTSNVSRLAHVTLWTDWAIPTVSFDIFLSPRDEQSVNVQDIFTGEQPVTTRPANCTPALSPGTLHFNPSFRTGVLATDLANLRLAHTGATMALAPGARVAGSSHPAKAVGYITIDVVRQCTDLFPSDPGTTYFKDKGTGIATNDNVLIGDYFYADFLSGAALGEPAVHIRADANFGPNEYTFYARYVNASGRDDRQPLANAYATRQLNGGPLFAATTELAIWRDTKSNEIGLPAPGGKPHWAPLNLLTPIRSCDEDESCMNLGGSVLTSAAPLATQRVLIGPGGGIPATVPFGWLEINLNHRRKDPDLRTPMFNTSAQGWIVSAFGAAVSGSPAGAGLRAFRLPIPETYCKP